MSKVQLAVGVGAAVLAYYYGKNTAGGKSMCTRSKYGTEKEAEGELMEYSVIYTDRAVNLLSAKFQKCMRDLNAGLKMVYQADGCVLIPGSGSYAMEAAARQFGLGKKCMVLRNGYFSYRWSDIFEQGKLPGSEIVIKALAQDQTAFPKFAPVPVAEVVARILAEKPDIFFAPHVETSTGIILPDSYILELSKAVHSYGGFLLMDCIASGTIWLDMKALGIDILITAPQKGWSAPASVGIAMLSERAKQHAMSAGVNDQGSFTCNLKKWLEVMTAYEKGGAMYYTTIPTDALMAFRDAMQETIDYGLEKAKADLHTLGSQMRAVLEKHGFPSVAAVGWQAPGVVVSYATHATMVAKFKEQGIQIAGGVPFKIDEPEGLMTWRLGLFGLDKIANIPRTIERLETALVKIIKK